MAGGLSALALCTTPAAAQRLSVSGDLLWRSEYVWRGLVRTNGPLLDADIYATVAPGPRWTFAVGGWWGLQLRGVSDSAFGDRSSGAIAESNPWAQASRRVGATDLTLGVTRYFYSGEATRPYARGPGRNSTEVYTRAVLEGRRVGAATTVWWDVDRVRGLYLETTVTLNVPLMPIPLPLPLGRLDPMFGNLFLDLTTGWNMTQGPAQGSLANYADRGLTHLDLGASTSVLVRNLISIDLIAHVQASRDAATRRVTPQRSAGLNTWFAVAVRPLCLICAQEQR